MRGVRKTLALLGLGALGLIGYQLMLGQVTLVDAAQRATAVMIALMVLQWLARIAVSIAVKRLEVTARQQSNAAARAAAGAMPPDREGIDLEREDQPAS